MVKVNTKAISYMYKLFFSLVNGSEPAKDKKHTVTIMPVRINNNIPLTRKTSTRSSTSGKIVGTVIGILFFCFILVLVWKRIKCTRYLPLLRGKFNSNSH